MRILLVEDDDSIREVLKLILESEAPFPNFIVETASNGIEALSCVEKFKPDVVLLDLTLPEGHGFDIFKQIRSIENCGNLPVVAVTAHNHSDLQNEAEQLGFAGYVTKPIDFESSLYPTLTRIAERFKIDRAA